MQAHTETTFRKVISFLDRLIDKFIDDNTFSMAAALAYYAALSMAPLLMLFLALAANLNFELQSDFTQEIVNLIGVRAGEVIAMILAAAKDREDLKGLSGVFGFVTLAVSSSAVFVELKSSLNRILKADVIADANQSFLHSFLAFLKNRILNIGFVLSFLFILLVSLLFSAVISLYVPSGSQVWARFVSWGFSFFVQLLLFTLLYRYVPDRKQRWKKSFLSGVITTTLFVTGKEFVGVYLGQSAVGSAYGAAGSVIVLLIWIFYSALIVFTGAQISYLLMKGRGNE